MSGIKDDPTVFQISVQIQPGNSGGPLFNQSGEVIDITQSSLDPEVAVGAFGTLPQNVNYAIKSSYISNLLPNLPENLITSRGISVSLIRPLNKTNKVNGFASLVRFYFLLDPQYSTLIERVWFSTSKPIIPANIKKHIDYPENIRYAVTFSLLALVTFSLLMFEPLRLFPLL